MGFAGWHELSARHPQIDRLGDGMGDVLGYARVSTDDQDVEGQRRRLKTAASYRSRQGRCRNVDHRRVAEEH